MQLIDAHLHVFRTQLTHERDPAGLLPLFMKDYGDLNALAAAILWLLEKQVPLLTIINSGILHKLVEYNAFQISQPNNDVIQFYSLLQTFQQARALIELASTYASQITGLASYGMRLSLCGIAKLHQPDALIEASITIPRFNFTINAENFVNLYKTFGVIFLIEAITLAAENHSNISLNSIIDHFIKHNLTMTELSILLDSLVKCGDRLTEFFSVTFFKQPRDDQFIHALIESSHTSVLHMAPYNTTVWKSLQKADLHMYIQQELIEKSTVAYDTIHKLSSLFKCAVSQHDEDAVITIFNVLLRFIMKHEIFDDFVPELLADCWHGHQHLQNKILRCGLRLIHELSLSLDHAIDEFAVDYNQNKLHLIEDLWLTNANQLRFLQNLINSNFMSNIALDKQYPDSKRALHLRLAEKIINSNDSQFDLAEFLQWCNTIPANNQSIDVSAYEYLLIDILSAIDQEKVRQDAIKLLESPPIARADWMSKSYANKNILIKACEFKNFGLLLSGTFVNHCLGAINSINTPQITLKTLVGLKQFLCSHDQEDLHEPQLSNSINLAVDRTLDLILTQNPEEVVSQATLTILARQYIQYRERCDDACQAFDKLESMDNLLHQKFTQAFADLVTRPIDNAIYTTLVLHVFAIIKQAKTLETIGYMQSDAKIDDVNFYMTFILAAVSNSISFAVNAELVVYFMTTNNEFVMLSGNNKFEILKAIYAELASKEALSSTHSDEGKVLISYMCAIYQAILTLCHTVQLGDRVLPKCLCDNIPDPACESALMAAQRTLFKQFNARIMHCAGNFTQVTYSTLQQEWNIARNNNLILHAMGAKYHMFPNDEMELVFQLMSTALIHNPGAFDMLRILSIFDIDNTDILLAIIHKLERYNDRLEDVATALQEPPENFVLEPQFRMQLFKQLLTLVLNRNNDLQEMEIATNTLQEILLVTDIASVKSKLIQLLRVRKDWFGGLLLSEMDLVVRGMPSRLTNNSKLSQLLFDNLKIHTPPEAAQWVFLQAVQRSDWNTVSALCQVDPESRPNSQLHFFARKFLRQHFARQPLSFRSPDFPAQEHSNICNLIIQLTKEINSIWPYPNKDRKAKKIAVLSQLLLLANGLGSERAIHTDQILAWMKNIDPEVLKGEHSTRTRDLLHNIKVLLEERLPYRAHQLEDLNQLLAVH